MLLATLDAVESAPSSIHDARTVLIVDSVAHARRILRAASVGRPFGPYGGETAPYIADPMVSSTGHLFERGHRLPWGLGDARLTLWKVPAGVNVRTYYREELEHAVAPYPDLIVEFGPRGGVRVRRP